MKRKKELDKVQREQLAQIFENPICDGDLISKIARDALNAAGLVTKHDGINYITGEGVRIAFTLGIGNIATPKWNAVAEALSELYRVYYSADSFAQQMDDLMLAYDAWLD